jgi:phage terminase large subunit
VIATATTRDRAIGQLRRWREDPVAFVRECFGVEPDAWQAHALMDFARSQRLAMKACKGPGKTTVLAWIVWNFLATRPYANVAATSISGDNLQDGLWKELAKWQHRSAFLLRTFEWQKTRIVAKEAPAHWWASARQWSKSADASQQANTLAGLHADYMLFVIDEAGGVPQAVAATAEAALASGIETKFVIAGNPTSTEGPLWMACTQHAALWKVIEITGDPDAPERSPRISKEWARQQIEMYGRDNPWVLVNVFGQFPPGSINALLGPDEVHEAMRRWPADEEYEWSQKRIGVDVARFGDDRTVLFPRQGLAAFDPVEMRGARTTAIAARVMHLQADWSEQSGDRALALIDDTGGWGHGTVDNLIAAGQAPIAVQYHAPAIDRQYKNRRAEMWMEMAKWVKRGGCLPNIPELVAELTTPTYTFVSGQFLIEDKDLVKGRLGRSPDLADALALTFALPEMPRHVPGPGHRSRRGKGVDYDPLSDDRMRALEDAA